MLLAPFICDVYKSTCFKYFCVAKCPNLHLTSWTKVKCTEAKIVIKKKKKGMSWALQSMLPSKEHFPVDTPGTYGKEIFLPALAGGIA